MNKAVLTALIVTIVIVIGFIIFLCILTTPKKKNRHFFSPLHPVPHPMTRTLDHHPQQRLLLRPLMRPGQRNKPVTPKNQTTRQKGRKNQTTLEPKTQAPKRTVPYPGALRLRLTLRLLRILRWRLRRQSRLDPPLSTTAFPIETLPLTPTKEDETLFDNLTALLFELIITVYREHLPTQTPTPADEPQSDHSPINQYRHSHCYRHHLHHRLNPHARIC